MTRSLWTTALALLLIAGGTLAFHAEPVDDPEVDAPAPDFTLTDTNGNEHSLSDFEGEYVVLEWLNFDCPFVGKFYGSGEMPRLQETYREDGVVWLSIVSSAPGTQGHFPPDEMNARNEQEGGQQDAILMDPEGTVGQMYGAQTTPHMYVINPEGTLIYKGGIDSIPSTNVDDIDEATNYVVEALDAAMNGEEVPTKTAPPYGCSVKYAG
ncbi:thioredoxin family protein [Longimonas halophila]|uniref:Thioredoxin family protein n=1 Tax=Longimonas halophila TaxID=1469170 RepID=A0A2H3NSH1_9BACT|nr:thioredoxin family protein [Longimonas halophila]PEN06661.1 thioredoxin family protein [Longimonas halophila]